MRIVAGELKGRVIREPRRALRPTSERVREALFSMLTSRLQGALVLEGFAGTGALGCEALSRGARRVCFVESDIVTARALGDTAADLGVSDRVDVIRADWLRWANGGSGRDRAGGRKGRPVEGAAAAPRSVARFDLVLLDPPYELPQLHEAVVGGASRVAPGGLMVVEAGEHDELPTVAGPLHRVDERRYGGTRLGFFE